MKINLLIFQIAQQQPTVAGLLTIKR